METRVSSFKHYVVTVLIVPCGMETSDVEATKNFISVLIVPCGMETGSNRTIRSVRGSINCTLRNGNATCSGSHGTCRAVLIVPCGMETKEDYTSARGRELVLIVPCGMETRVRQCLI